MKQNLRALEVCYYVYGGIICLMGFIPLIYVALGTFFSSGFFAQHAQEEFPHLLGPLFILIGTVVFLFVEAWGIVNIMNGRIIANRKWRIFSMVIAGLNCMGGVLGIALGVFTFVMLTKSEVQNEYHENAEILTDRAY